MVRPPGAPVRHPWVAGSHTCTSRARPLPRSAPTSRMTSAGGESSASAAVSGRMPETPRIDATSRACASRPRAVAYDGLRPGLVERAADRVQRGTLRLELVADLPCQSGDRRAVEDADVGPAQPPATARSPASRGGDRRRARVASSGRPRPASAVRQRSRCAPGRRRRAAGRPCQAAAGRALRPRRAGERSEPAVLDPVQPADRRAARRVKALAAIQRRGERLRDEVGGRLGVAAAPPEAGRQRPHVAPGRTRRTPPARRGRQRAAQRRCARLPPGP